MIKHSLAGLALALVTVTTTAGSASDFVADVVGPYLAIQTALVNDDLAPVNAAATALRKSAGALGADGQALARGRREDVRGDDHRGGARGVRRPERGDHRLRRQDQAARGGQDRRVLPDGQQVLGAGRRRDRQPVLRQGHGHLRQPHARRSRRPDDADPLHPPHARQRTRRDRPRGSRSPDRGGQCLVPRRLEERAARPDGVRAPVRAPHVRGLGPSRSRVLRAAAARGRVAQRIDECRSHQLLGSGARRRARPRPVARVRPDGPPAAGAHAGQVRQPARRRAQRAAPELREPTVRPRRHCRGRRPVRSRPSVQLADDRLPRRPARRLARRRARVLPDVLPPRECVARARGQHHGRTRLRSRRAVLRRRASGPRCAAGARGCADPDDRGAPAARGSRRAAAPLSRLAFAGAVRSTATRNSTCWPTCSAAARPAASIAPSSSSSRSPPK